MAIFATIFNKIQSYFGLCNYFVFKGLYYYLLESSLFNRNKQHKEQPKITKKTKGSSTSQINNKISSTEKQQQQLNKDKDRLLRVPFFDSIIWTFNYSCFALIIFILSDLYNFSRHILSKLFIFEKIFFEGLDLNASLIWTFCALILQINVLLNIAFEKLTVVELFPERNTLVCASGFLFFTFLKFNLKMLFLHFSFLSPIGIFLLFLRPIVDQILETQIINYEQLKSLRLLLLFLNFNSKNKCSKTFLQTFLDKPKNIINEYSFKNMKEEERQKKIANYASYACTAALQYYMPITIILSIGLLLKNFGKKKKVVLSLVADISFYSLLPEQYFGKIEQKSLPILSKQNDQKSIILNILFSKELHEPLWTLALTNLIFGQIIICLFGVLMRKTMGGGRDGKR
ncbi:hypothetical protein Mgra_00005920 [Meloidogyne graminicola]|uniref:Transmembrane protein n=1 Tax=Meloidogyne graminicola TaxID=189291 RepID=A0A8S9ZN79_9BILA|nr:hypothetical protein Mgra_00005920 [Meloidogyne graminicola]